MDGASPYHQVELQRWHAKIQRAQEDADFAAYEEKTLSDIQKEKDQKLAQLVADAKAEETKLEAAEKEASDLLESNQQRELGDLLTKHEGQTALRKRDAEHATKQLTKKNEADKELLLSTYADKGFKAETEIQNQMQQRQLDRAMEDQTWSAELCRIADEQSRLTIEVQPRVVASTPAHAAEPLQRGHFQRSSVSAAAAVLESPVRGTELNMLMRGPETTQPRSRVSSVTPTKRTMADSPYENRTPPNLRRIVSDNITPAADGDIFTTSSSSASSGGLPSPTALLSRLPEFTQGATPARSVSISSASSQSTTRSPGQITQSPTPHSNRRQTIGTNGTSNGMNERLVDGFLQPQSSAQARSTSCATPPKFSLGGAVKPASQPQGIPPSAPIPLSRATFQTNSSPLSASRGTTISVNFEIMSVRYSYASGGGFYNWTRDSAEPTRYLRLSQGVYRPVLQQGRKTGSVEWTIDPSRVWALKYDTDSSLVYITRSKADNKTGNAGGEMWIVFKNEENLKGFLESYRKNWPHNPVGEIGLDDEVPLSLMKKRR